MNPTTDIRRRLLLLPALLLCGVLPASEWFVAPGGNDAATGRAITAPFRTIARAVSVARGGDTIRLRGGTYRESVAVANKVCSAVLPLVIAAYGSEIPVIKGSLQVTGWTLASGTTWKKTGWTYPSQDVFDDSAPLQKIGPVPGHYAGNAADGSWMLKPVGTGVASMTPGSFYVDAAAKTLYVKLKDGSNPNGSLIEAAAARKLLTTSGSTYVVVRGVSFRHSNTSAYEQIGAAVELGTNCRLEKCDVQWCDFAGVGLTWALGGAQVLDSVVSNNGDVGIEGAKHANLLIRGCTIAGNKRRAFNGAWHGGGIKITTDSWGVVERNRIIGNQAAGVWFDWCASGSPLTIRCNYLANNVCRTAAIDLEGSRNGLVTSNVVVDNEIRGIYISACDDIKVTNNTVVGTRSYCGIDIGGMPRATRTLTNVAVMNNIIANGTSTDDLRILKANGSDIRNLTADNNLFWRPSGTVALWYGADSRGGWAGTRCTSLAQWRSVSPYDHHGAQANPQFSVASADNWACNGTSPAVNRGRTLSEAVMAYGGLARPLGGGYDVGAYER